MAGTVVLPGPVSRKLEEVIVAAAMAREKVAVTATAGFTPVALLAGKVVVTVGGGGGSAVVKVHSACASSGVPSVAWTHRW